MLIDSHIHVGQFYDYYFAPSYIHKLMEQLNIQYYAVSSTTMCEENYPKVIDEIHELIELDGSKVLPVMWITPEGLKGNIAWLLDSDIKWACIKLHPFLHQEDWQPDSEKLMEVVEISRELDLPLLIHTGNEICCNADKYEALIANNPDVSFILAHGRPANKIVGILQRNQNAFADSAFMPLQQISAICNAGLSNKLLWGTDMCIPKYFYPEEDLESYYRRKLNDFKEVCSTEQFEQVTYKNAMKLFNLK